jgi:hypothetical protein
MSRRSSSVKGPPPAATNADFSIDCAPNQQETAMLMHVIHQLRTMVAGSAAS